MKYFKIITVLTALLSSAINQANLQPFGDRIDVRIIGGSNAYAGQYPFAAAIHVQTSQGRYFCGGALISNQWILTGAQCVDQATLLTIQLGSNTLSTEDRNRITVATSEYVIHPQYDASTLANDIALIKLREVVQFNNYLKSIQLPTVPIQVSTSLVAMGWGQVDDVNPELAEQLNWVQVSSISKTECQNTYGSQITDNMVCVDGNYNEGACVGDSGSPLIHVVGRNEMVHAGISSFISGNGCQSTDPSGYTGTFAYLGWIRNVTQN